jgi:6-pyruvoyltetrahydropterin/6-carboxytetrahydropterin synthase
MYSATIETGFSAAHFLRGYKGACSQLHGHNWRVIVEVRSDVLDDIGMSVDFYLLQRKTDEILKEFDHKEINSIPPFDKNVNPTSENIARWIYDELKTQLPPRVSLSFVAIKETDNYTAKYSEE